MPNIQPGFDVTGRQRRWEQEGKALDKFLEASEHIKNMEAQLNRQANQLEEHNKIFSEYGIKLQLESAERRKADRSSRWFSVLMALLSFVLGVVASHFDAIITWAKSLLRLVSHP